MRKNVLLLIPIAVVTVLLFMFRATGMPAHIAVSVSGVLLLAAYTVLTKESWRCPALEVVTRLLYAIALISGIVLMNVHGINAIAIVHKISAALFAVILIATEIHKSVKK